MEELKVKQGVLGWFASNHVAANLLMLLILVGGIVSMRNMTVEIFPDTSVDVIAITVPYLGASPEEVEEGVCVRVEEAIAGVEGIKRLISSASEGGGSIMVEVDDFYDLKEVLDDIKAEIDRIETFPKETEEPIIQEITTREPVIHIVVYGDVEERTLKNLVERIRDDLTAMDNISQVDFSGARRFEISIEISEENLRRYELSFDEIANVVKKSSLDLPGGSIKTEGGEILVRTKGQKYIGSEFEEIVVLRRTDGSQVLLGDIADIVDDFEDSDLISRFDGKPSISLRVFAVGEQNVPELAGTVKEYVKKSREEIPEGVSITTWYDRSVFLRSRIELLQRNAMIGLTLVFLCLLLFLDLRLAFWTTMGIPISFLGAFWLMPVFDVSINMLSLFAFILALGIVVDDAIVVGENIFAYRQKGIGIIEAATLGVREMAAPVTMAVLTTIFAFMPLLNIYGIFGKFIRVIPIIVISVLSFSLVEALLILPAHLSGKKGVLSNLREPGHLAKFQNFIRSRLDSFIQNRFAGMVEKVVEWRYLTVAVSIAILLGWIGYIKGGYIKFSLLPKVDADNVWVALSMPQGTNIEQTKKVVSKIEDAAHQLQAEIDSERSNGGESVIRHMETVIGDQPFTRDGSGGPPRDIDSSSNIAEVVIGLLEGEKRNIASAEIANRWREKVGEIAGVSTLAFSSSFFSGGDAINVEMSHYDFDTLLVVVEKLKEKLYEFEGVTDISDSFEPGKLELKLSLKEQGRISGLTLSDLARQVRQGFYGQEVQRVQRGRDDIKVMIRYPKNERKSLADIENMRVRLPDGTQIPFRTVAEVKHGRGYATIKRANRRRVVNVTADVDQDIANSNEINAELAGDILPELKNKYPGLNFKFEGEQKEQKEIGKSLSSNYIIALLAIFGLLAVQFRSYIQPVIIMMAIPFGLIGALIGHVFMGFDLSILSIFGFVALTGVVVNDSLIMVDLINRERREGIEIHQVIRDSATRRFRPIMLTTMTTFCGLVPMMLERSLQARFLIPMAISLAFGVAFATLITLFLVPSLYMILEDIKHRVLTWVK